MAMGARLTKCGAPALVVAGVFVGLVAGVAAPADEGVQDRDTKGELLVLGPFPLGRLYENMENVKHRDLIPKGGGPSHASIIKALNECKVYVIDRRVRDN